MGQRLEGDFSRSLKNCNVWFLKLQVMPLAHQTMPADYIILTKDQRHLVECKEVDCRRTTNGRFGFDRVSQLSGLQAFDEFCEDNFAALLLSFRDRSMKKSNAYFIPISVYTRVTNEWENKSMTREQCNELFSEYELEVLPGSLYDLSCIYEEI